MTINVNLIKSGAKLISGFGITAICGAAIGQLPIKAKNNFFGRIAVALGGVVLAGIVSKAGDEYIDITIDNFFSNITEALDSIRKVSEVTEASEEMED